MPRRVSLMLVLAACTTGEQPLLSSQQAAAGSSSTRLDDEATTLIWSTGYGQDFAGMAGGDLNGDGHADLVLGSEQATVYTGLGAVWVFYGSSTGVPDTPDLILDGTEVFDFYGASVAATDLNGDGYDDLAIGAAYTDSPAGVVYIHYGGAAGLPTTPDVTLSVSGSNQFGSQVAAAGDVDADGYSDLVIADADYTDDGLIHLFRGGSGGVETTPTSTLSRGSGSGGYFGASLAGLGDVNGDGYADIAVGAPYAGSYAGRIFVYFGSASGLGPTPGAHMDFPGESSSTFFGFELAGAGDIDGDGYDDMIAGAEREGGAGAAYLYLGSSTGPGSAPDQTLSSAIGDDFGSAVAGPGDIDGDGYDDVLIGDSGVGEVYVYPGGADGLAASLVTTVRSGSSWSLGFGNGALGLGDVDGDGVNDVVIRDGYLADWDSTWQGMAHVFHGQATTDNDGDGWSSEWDCNDSDASVLPWHCADPDDIIIDGSSLTSSGVWIARAVWVVNGGSLTVTNYNGTAIRGWLSINAGLVYVDASSTILGTGAGYRGSGSGGDGEGAGGGEADPAGFGGGGGHGGRGGDGMIDCSTVSGNGGEAHGGDDDRTLRMGSAGGSGAMTSGSTGRGGRGGGAIGITADSLILDGRISVDGLGPPSSLRAERGGGGAGGTVLIEVEELSCGTGFITARGGAVSDGSRAGRAGPGGGGRIQFEVGSGDPDSCRTSAVRGRNGCAASGVEAGTVSDGS